MHHTKNSLFLKFILLLALPLLACSVFQTAPTTTPRPVYTMARRPTRSPTVTGTPLSPTQAARRTALAKTQAAQAGISATTTQIVGASPTETRTAGPTRTPISTKTPTITVTPTPEFPRTDYVSIPAPALANNMLNEPLQRDLTIYLPTSYINESIHYPVVYYLLDLGLEGRDVTITTEELQKDVAADLSKEMIVVIISGVNSLGGSLYVNSPVSGNWEDFIVQDVVRYVDGRYRTIAAPTSRGISGYGVGGFGALSIAMHHPDVFSVVYAISPYLFDADGLAASPLFAAPRTIDAVLDLQARELALPTAEAIPDMQHAGDAQFSIAYGVAFAPNLNAPPPFMDYPYYRQNGRVFRDEAIWQRWETGFGAIPGKILQYKTNLRQLRAIGLGCGEHPPYMWILTGCKDFSTRLTQDGITNQLISFPGGIEPMLDQGIRAFVLPFFSEQLTFNP